MEAQGSEEKEESSWERQPVLEGGLEEMACRTLKADIPEEKGREREREGGRRKASWWFRRRPREKGGEASERGAACTLALNIHLIHS
jgi:hypothetical protein